MVYVIVLVISVLVSACDKSETPAAQITQLPPAVDPNTAGSLTGHVIVDAFLPEPDTIRMDGDPKCVAAAKGDARPAEYFVTNDGKSLGNVFIYIKEGLPQRFYAVPPTPVVFDQQQCRYVPHVLGIQVGQPLEIRNSDPLLHNVHAEGVINQPFDLGQPLQGIKTTHTFTTREVMIPVKCQVHNWMRGYIGVVEHPFFAVTDGDGRYTIPQLPPGTYTIEAWHERLGTQTQKLTVGPKETKTLDLTFKMMLS